MIQEKIKIDLKSAMINKDEEKKSLLRVVIGEFNRIGKELSDKKAISIIKKMVDNAIEQGNDSEVLILKPYLPSQMNELELKRVLMNYLENLEHSPTMKDMGGAMIFLKDNYAGQYDGKMASLKIKELINN